MGFTSCVWFGKGVKMSDGYYRTRFLYDKTREVVWREENI